MRTPRHTRRRPGDLWYVAAIAGIAFAIVLRVGALDQQGLWHDEIYTIAHLSGYDPYLFPGSDLTAVEPPTPVSELLASLNEDRYSETLGRNLVHEGHPPLYQLGLKAWTSLFGKSVTAIRSFSLFPAILTILLMFLLGMRLQGLKLATAATVLVGVSPFHLYYSVEARNYSWSLLFVTLALVAASLIWQREKERDLRWLALWWIAVVGACYTHYYAGLYCAVLMLVVLGFRKRSLSALAALGLPFLLFLPWLPVLVEQVTLSSAQHWTAGAPTFPQAVLGVGNVLLDQLTGVFKSASIVERVLAGFVLVVGLFTVIRNPVRANGQFDERWLLISVPVFVFTVFLVDLATDHHTIVVSRYLASIFPCLILTCVWIMRSKRLSLKLILLAMIMSNAGAAYATAQGHRAPKQMLREAGAFIAQRYSSDDLVLVTPTGPSLIGLAFNLPPDALIAGAPPDQAGEIAKEFAADEGTVWLARQNLGASYEMPDRDGLSPTAKSVRFAGIDVIPVDEKSAR